jgi:hypothetical protein
MALGARKQDVLGMVVSHGAKLATAGVLFGAAASFLLMRWMAGLLFGVS